jgi:hypothetical protein
MNRNLHLLLIYLFSLSFFCASSMVILSRDLQVFMGVDVDRLFIISSSCRDNIHRAGLHVYRWSILQKYILYTFLNRPSRSMVRMNGNRIERIILAVPCLIRRNLWCRLG